MPTLLAPVAIQQFKDNNGNSLIGGQLFTYQAGTSIPAPSYTDATGTSANTNPVILNSRGEAPIWLTPGQFYKLVLQDASGVLIWSADQVPGGFVDAALLPDTASTNKLRADLAASGGAARVATLATGAGAVLRTLESRARDYVHIKDYGGVEDGVTDDSGAFDRAAVSLMPLGGTIRYSGRTRIGVNYVLRDGCTIEGPKAFNAGNTGYTNALGTSGSALIVDSTATISLGNNSGITKSLIVRKGLIWPETSTAAFAGTAITVAGNSTFVSNCMIAGFNLAFTSTGFQEIKLIDVFGDCLNGISIINSPDKSYLVRVHFWPFVTAGSTGAALQRSGVAFYLSGVQSYNSLVDCFSYGYFRGCSIADGADISLIGCGLDGDGAFANSIGVLIGGNSTGIALIGCRTSGQSDGVYVNCTNSAGIANSLTGHNSWGNTTRGIVVNQGNCNIVGGNSFNNPIGIQGGLSTAKIAITSVAFANVPLAIDAAVANSNMVIDDGCLYTGVTTRRSGNVQSSVRTSNTAIVLTGTQSITFNHGLLIAPVFYSCVPVNSNLAGTSFWIGNATATQITIFTSANVATNMSFIWEARIYA